jgi:hypothetical protein
MVGEDPMSRLLLHKFPVSLLLLSLTGCTCDGIDDGVWTFQEPWAEDVYTEPDTLAPSAADSPGGEPETDAGSAEPEPVPSTPEDEEEAEPGEFPDEPFDFDARARLTAGDGHTCLLLRSGRVKCWGSNDRGQLGDGTLVDRLAPVEVRNLDGVVSISAGSDHTCALHEEGSLTCWGGIAMITPPQRVAGLSGVRGLASGYYNVVCVRMDSGGVKCRYRDSPGGFTEVPGLDDAMNVATGCFHYCAVLESGIARCWGADGVLDYGSEPKVIEGLATPVQVTANRTHSCALVESGGVQCWGSNWTGQLGNETLTDSLSPVDVLEITDARQLTVGCADYTCALLHSGRVRCWGANRTGQLGNGTTNERSMVTDVLDLHDAVQLAGGPGHACALLRSEEVKCWGLNRHGQLGDGTTVDRLTPVYVRGL